MVFRGGYRFFKGAERSWPRTWLAAAVIFAFAGLFFQAPSSAAGASPWWRLEAISRPSDPGASEGEAEVALSAINLGNGPAGGPGRQIVLADTLPQGVTILGASGVVGFFSRPIECHFTSLRSVECEYDGALSPYEQIEVRIRILLAGDAWESQMNEFTVTGGGAPPVTLERQLFHPIDPGQLGFDEFDLRPEEEGGATASRAGSHPYQVTAAFAFTQSADAMPTALPKDLRLRLPPGLTANVSSVAACPLTRFHEDACPLNTIVGVGIFTINDRSSLGVTRLAAPIFELEPSLGRPARFGAFPFQLPVIIDSTIRPDDYSAELSIGNISQVVGFLGATITLWGVPGDRSHDPSRGFSCLFAAYADPGYSCPQLEDPNPQAMLTMPTSCGDPPLRGTIEVAPWGNPLHAVASEGPFPRVTGCENVPFQPNAEATASGAFAASPSGFELDLDAPGDGLRSPEGTAESALRKVEVTLPEGVTINPSVANGLGSCSRLEYESESLRDGGCPDTSKIGAVAIESPIFSGALNGSAYVGEGNKRFDGSLDLYLLARNISRGLLVKIRAQLRLDVRSGRVTVVAERLPQLPFSSLRLSFPPGPRALLATPSRCRTSSIETALAPYSNPAAALRVSSPLPLTSGPGGGPCPDQVLPFHPHLEAGTLVNAAARHSSLYVRLSRADAEAELAGLSLVLPPGLAVRLAGLPACPPAALLAAAARAGSAEAASPACPAASKVGRTMVGAGVGPVLSYLPGVLYLGGPFRGAPFSVAAVIPAQLGPLDLGTVVRRFPVEVDPQTGQVSIGFEADQRLPSVLGGIALHLRDLRLYFDRENFIVNPTSCSPLAFGGSAHATDGAVAAVGERFQAAGCAGLPFKPSLSLRLSGGLGRNGHPGLRATIRGAARGARIEAAGFTLPPGELLDFRHLRDLCARGVPAASCSASSRVGHIRLRTPLLDQPLRGSIHLRAPTRGLPEFVAELRGGGVRLVLRGRAAAPGGRLGISLTDLPDLPLTEGVVVLDGGRNGLLANSEALCGSGRRASALLIAHNGKARHLRPRPRLRGRC